MADLTLDGRARQRVPEGVAHDRYLRVTAAVFAVAVVVHGADHLRRGVDVVTTVVRDAGAIQFVLGAVAVVLVFRGHRWAPAAAVFVGFASAAGFSAAHLLPHWSAFSDPYVGSVVAPRVNGLSWFSALFGIAADLAFGIAGLRALWARQ
jgi:hypothetical protein